MLGVRVGATFGMIKHDKQKGVDGQENHLGTKPGRGRQKGD